MFPFESRRAALPEPVPLFTKESDTHYQNETQILQSNQWYLHVEPNVVRFFRHDMVEEFVLLRR